MTAANAKDFLMSNLSDLHDVPLSTDIEIADAEYVRIMRRIILPDETDTQVSAFNSSI